MNAATESRPLIVTAILIVLAAATSPAAGDGLSTDGSLYETWETEIVNARDYENPFDFEEIQLNATFRSPSNRIFAFYGFYDGDGEGGQEGPVWKLRFLPDEVGRWTYTYSWSDGTPGGDGSIDVGSSSLDGPLKIDPANRHSIIHASGGHFYYNGETEWCFLSDDFSEIQRIAALDFLAEMKINQLLICLAIDTDHRAYPWLGPRNSVDLTRFDLERLSRWDQVIGYMADQGIVADLWFYSDQSTNLIPEEDSPEEDLYYKYIVARYAAFRNVNWNLALEYEEYRTRAWVERRAQFVENLDPWNHLMGVHQHDVGEYQFPGNPHLDRTSIQDWGDPDELNSAVIDLRNATQQAGRPIPIVIDEFYIEGASGAMGDFDRFVSGVWTIALGGGYIRGASMGWTMGPHFEEAEHFLVQKLQYELMTRIPHWHMGPHNELVDRGFALARIGSDYLVFLPHGGSVELDLRGMEGSKPYGWYDPSTGLFIPSGSIPGGAFRAFTAPTPENWLLYVGVLDATDVDPAIPMLGGSAPVLGQNQPNPFRLRTVVPLLLPEGGAVDLRLFDSSGRLAANILDGAPLIPGRHTIPLKAGDLPAGVYFLQVMQQNQTMSRKVLVLK